MKLIKKLSKILKADLTTLFDLAGASKKTIAPDIEEYIKNNPEIISLIRTTKENKISAKEISNMEKK